MERRRFVAGLGGAGLLAAGHHAARAQPTRARRSFVLVHGAWHGGWCWVRVAERLRAAGHVVHTPTLTGLGERSHLISPLVTLDTHIADIVNVIEFEELNDVVLVGHSYAGTIISGVADRIAPRLSRLVYLDAQFLDPGKSLFDLLPPEVVEQRLQTIRQNGGGVGAASIPPAAFGVRDAADAAWVSRRVTPQPVGTYSHRFHLKAPMGNGVAKTYIDCTLDPIATLAPMKARVRADAGWTVRTLATGHDAMIIAPGPLTEMLLEDTRRDMALTGTAFLALFNDIDPARDEEYNAWHSGEHVPQRLTVPGMARARRYANRAEPRFPYFTLYEAASTGTLLSQPYLDLLANPTPWSAAMRASFRQFLRIPCRTVASAGEGIGGAVAVLTCTLPALPDEQRVQHLCQALLALPGTVGVHAGEQDASLPGPMLAAAQTLTVHPTLVLLVETQEPQWLTRHHGSLATLLERSLPGCKIEAAYEYQLMHLLTEGRAPSSPPCNPRPT